MTDFDTARKNMVDSQIQTAGIIYPGLLEAFRIVPRETFVPEALQRVCYADEELLLGGGRYLPEPVVHARMVQAVEPKNTDKVLDIGGSSGYPAAILSAISGQIYALEDQPFLNYATQVWSHLNMNNIIATPGILIAGAPQAGPFDVIILNGAVSDNPLHLTEQLAPGGRMVCIVKKPGAVMGQVTLTVNSVGNKFSSRILFEAGGHYLPGFEPQPGFVFK